VASDQQERQQAETGQQDDRQMTDKPEVKEEHKKVAKEMMKEYDEDRPTVKMPGSDGTVAGTAVADWLDEDGNPKFSDESKGDSDESKGDSDEKVAEEKKIAAEKKASFEKEADSDKSDTEADSDAKADSDS
jgi:hypothetical protein